MLSGEGIIKFSNFKQISAPNLQILFPSQKLSSPGKKYNQFPPGKSDPKFPFLPKVLGRNDTMCGVEIQLGGQKVVTNYGFLIKKSSIKLNFWPIVMKFGPLKKKPHKNQIMSFHFCPHPSCPCLVLVLRQLGTNTLRFTRKTS